FATPSASSSNAASDGARGRNGPIRAGRAGRGSATRRWIQRGRLRSSRMPLRRSRSRLPRTLTKTRRMRLPSMGRPCHIPSGMTPFTPRYTNLVTMFRESTQRFAERPFCGVRRAGGWHWHSYAEVGKMVADCRGGLAALGVGKGDRVGVISNNRLEWLVGCYATHSLGAAYGPMYENQPDTEGHYILADSGAKVVPVGTA